MTPYNRWVDRLFYANRPQLHKTEGKQKERKVEYRPSTRKNGLDVKYQSRSSWQAIEWTTSIYTFIISTIDNFFLRYDCGTFIYLSIYMVHVYYIHLSNLYCFLLTFRAIYVILFECHHLYCCDMMYIYHTTFLFLCHHWCAFVCLFGHRTIFYYIYRYDMTNAIIVGLQPPWHAIALFAMLM